MEDPKAAKLSPREAQDIRRQLEKKKQTAPKGTREPDDPSPDPGDGSERPTRKPPSRSGR